MSTFRARLPTDEPGWADIVMPRISLTLTIPGQTWHFADCAYDPDQEFMINPLRSEPPPLEPPKYAVNVKAIFRKATRVTQPDDLVTITKAEWDEYQAWLVERSRTD